MIFFSTIVLLFCFVSCQGQETSSYTKHIIDSLDNIKPILYNKIKPKDPVCMVKINTQEEFSRINDIISEAINAGKNNIKLTIGKGIFKFYENCILRNEENIPNVSISVVGNHTVITSDEDYDHSNIIEAWSELQYADSIIEVIDKKKKLCRIPYRNQLDQEEMSKLTKVQISQWFRSNIYDVEKIDRNGIYFVAPELEYVERFGRKSYNVNYDYLYLKKKARFRLYNKTKEHNCSASCFIRIKNANYGIITIKGIDFKSNKGGAPLISLSNVKAKQVIINNCSFEHIRGNVVNFSEVGNVAFTNNIVRNTQGNEIRFVNNCPNVRVTGNIFENCGVMLNNTLCVTCQESSYYIANNIFSDFGSAAIGVGKRHKSHYSGGIIENNEIYFTMTYFAESWKHMLMDSGAIYTWTQNDDVIIRYNYIHDYAGAGDNRGIFCDDGANNIKIYGNIILNIANSYCIDSRFVKDQDSSFHNNSNNFLGNNIVNSPIRFQGYQSENRHCVKTTNYCFYKNEKQNNKYKDLEIEESDIFICLDEISVSEDNINKKQRNLLKRAIKDKFIRKKIRNIKLL